MLAGPSALVALATRLDRTRWRPRVVCLGPDGRLVALRAGIAVECLDANRKRPLQAVARLARSLKRDRPIHPASSSMPMWPRGSPRLCGVPWVLSGVRVAERQRKWHLTVDRLTAGMATGHVCVSHGVYRFCREVKRLPPERFTTIPNGVDTAGYDGVSPAPRDEIGLGPPR